MSAIRSFLVLTCLVLGLALAPASAFAQAAPGPQPSTPAAAPQPAPPAPAPAPAPAPGPLVGKADMSYVLGSGDRVRVIVFGEAALTGEYVVDSTGRLSMPLVGEVQVAGASIRQAERAIEAALREGYMNDPRVAIEVLNFRPFYILGEVRTPAEYPYVSGLTVFNAVAVAGGFTPLADQTRVFIKRAGAAAEEELRLDATVSVEPGDTIRIVKGSFYILGEVNAAAEYAYSEGLTVQKAVALARGFTYRANQSIVFIRRQGEARERRYRLTPDLEIKPGDTIRIAERFF